MPHSEQITINTDNIVLDQAAVSAHDLPKGEYLLICVSDSGTGIPEDIRERFSSRSSRPSRSAKELGWAYR